MVVHVSQEEFRLILESAFSFPIACMVSRTHLRGDYFHYSPSFVTLFIPLTRSSAEKPNYALDRDNDEKHVPLTSKAEGSLVALAFKLQVCVHVWD